MRRHEVTVTVLGPWSVETSRAFWQGFAPNLLPLGGEGGELSSAFLAEADWRRAEVVVTQHSDEAHLALTGDGDLDAAAAQVCRFLGLDVDGRGWPQVAERDPVIADAQARLPGLRPCGFYSAYEAAAWSVLSQRTRIVQAAQVRRDLADRYGDDGAFPSPQVLRALDLDLPGRKTEYLQAVADAALDGRLDTAALRSLDAEEAIRRVQEITGLGPFAAELVVVRGANAPDVMPRHERRLLAEMEHLYGPSHSVDEVSGRWRPYRTWAAVHLRALREERTHEVGRQQVQG